MTPAQPVAVQPPTARRQETVTTIHGQPSKEEDIEYLGHLGVVDYTFKDITFPKTLPDWYFDSKQYGAHQDDDPI